MKLVNKKNSRTDEIWNRRPFPNLRIKKEIR